MVRRDADGSLERPEGFGAVFVLLPAGRPWLGAQASDQRGGNYDPDAEPNELPIRQADVAAFFMSKYELTQAQWSILSEGDSPSREPGADRPVEFVDHAACVRVLGWHEMEVPSEEEWEYACRAGTTTAWWTGAKRDSLLGSPVAANIADATYLAGGAPLDRSVIWEEYDYGMGAHGRVGLLRPNSFGLHDTLGNVFEWCMPGGLADTPAGHAVARGGAWNKSAYYARSARRITVPNSGAKYDNLGIRPLIRLRSD